MKNILFIHQSSELYGSDKTLLMLVNGFKQKGHNPIVVLPQKGPLLKLLEENNIEVILTPVIKISRKMFGIKNLLSLPFQVSSSVKKIDKALKDVKVDCVYSNTLAVLIGLIYARKRKLPHIWHVHEIIEKPSLIKKVFIKLLSLKINNVIIHNSFATKKFWESTGKLSNKQSIVVWNGLSKDVQNSTNHEVSEIQKKLFASKPEDIVIGLMGRINRWKGQLLLLEAIKDDLIKNPSIKLVFVGSAPPNQEIYLNTLKEKIIEFHLAEQVKVIPFQENIWPVWQSIDIAVIPSTEPEPFGLVALEAMLCHKPVIASAHGGLTEIVSHNQTGILFEPNNVVALNAALLDLISDKQKREWMGKNGYERASTLFTRERYITEIEKVCLTI